MLLRTAVEHLVRPVERCEGSAACADALADQYERYDDPERVHQDKVAPVVCCLGPRVGQTQQPLVEQRRRVVQDITVELTQRNDDGERVTEGVVFGNVSRGEERQRTPCDLMIC